MTHDPKAPLPDEVESYGGYSLEWFEQKQPRQIAVNNTCVQDLVASIRKKNAHISALEARLKDQGELIARLRNRIQEGE